MSSLCWLFSFTGGEVTARPAHWLTSAYQLQRDNKTLCLTIMIETWSDQPALDHQCEWRQCGENHTHQWCFGSIHHGETGLNRRKQIEQLTWASIDNRPYFTAGILMCHSREATRVPNNIYDGSVLCKFLSKSWQCNGEPSCTILGPWNWSILTEFRHY